jgi:cell division protein FtsZ
MTLNLTIPKTMHTDFTPRITVIGVGGGGTNAVDNMIQLNLQGVDFVVANTDAQQLMHSKADRRIQLGPHLTQGLGAGAKPEIGKLAAEEAADELARHLDGAHMVFITAGMGGGTGTGAAPVIARMARERGILTVGVVTKPFTFEGARRAKSADVGIAELQQYVDTLIVIPNQNLFRLANEKTGWKEAFKMADHVLYMGVRGVTDLMVAPGLVNLDFADIRTVMAEMGKAMMGTGEAEGENRAIRAAEAAISNPLLEDTSMAGARGLLINITGGEDMTLFEVDQAANRIREEVADDANIIFGSAVDDDLSGRIRVSVVATGIDTPVSVTAEPAAPGPRLVAVGGNPGAAARTEAPRAETGRAEAPRPAMAQPGARFPVGVAATAVAYAPEEMQDQAQIAMQAPQPQLRPVAQPHPLFTQPASRAPEAHPASQAPKQSLFGKVTGGWRRHPAAQAGQDAPDLRHRNEPRMMADDEPSAEVHAAVGEPDPAGLDIPAFLRRQDNMGR